MSKKYAKFKRRPEHIEQKIVEKLSNTKTLYNILDKQEFTIERYKENSAN